MPKHSPRLSIIAAATLLAWVGAVYHDVWLGLAEIAHHHHEHSHGHSDGERDHGDHGEDEQPLVLSDIHSVPFIVGSFPSVGTAAFALEDLPLPGAAWIVELDLRGVNCANAPPPGWRRVHEISAAHLLGLAHCVQSNAPPAFV